MKTKTIELYEFEELPEEIQAKVLDNERNINTDDYLWYDCVYEDWKERLEKMGFENPEINFSGFWSQGDGASFTCKNVNIQDFITSQRVKGQYKTILKALKSDEGDICASVYRIDHHYSHENTVRAEVEASDKVYEEGRKLESHLTAKVRELSKQIYRDLEKEHEFLCSDEAVKDTILANKYTFTITGKMENL